SDPSSAFSCSSSSIPATSSAPSFSSSHLFTSAQRGSFLHEPSFGQDLSVRKRPARVQQTGGAAPEYEILSEEHATVDDTKGDGISIVSTPDSTSHRPKRVRKDTTFSTRASSSSSSSSFTTPVVHHKTALSDPDALVATCYGPLAFGFEDWGSCPSLTFAAPLSSLPHSRSLSDKSPVRERLYGVVSSPSGAFFSSLHALRESVYRFAASERNRRGFPLDLPSVGVVPSSLLHPFTGRRDDDRDILYSSADAVPAGSADVSLQERNIDATPGPCPTTSRNGCRVRVFPVDVPGGGVPVFLPVTSPDDERRRQEAVSWIVEEGTAVEETCASRGVKKTLRRSLKEILRDIMTEDAQEAAVQASEEENETELTVNRNPKRGSRREEHGAEKTRQWTEKYRARKVADLLTSASTNTSVFTWLRQWQLRLIRKEENSKKLQKAERAGMSLEGYRGPQAKAKDEDQSKNTKSTAVTEVEDMLPRLLLVGGPPGVGKTTLAHVAARHFGFDVVEINGSDERSRSTLLPVVMNCVTGADSFFHSRNKSKNAESLSVRSSGRPDMVRASGAEKKGMRNRNDPSTGCVAEMRKTAKPILLIVDEIDGAASGNAGGRGGDDEESETVVGVIAKLVKKRDAKGRPFIRRPIICICNNLYSRTLRPLREVAQILNLSPPPASAIAERLKEILSLNGFTADRELLDRVIDIFDGDIRACINCLYFISRKALRSGMRRLQQEDVEAFSWGKDREMHVQDFVRFVFTPWKRAGSSDERRTKGRLSQTSFSETLCSFAPAVDPQLAPALLQENFTQIVQNDWTLDKLAYGTELLAFGDSSVSLSHLAFHLSSNSFETEASSASGRSYFAFCMFASRFCATSASRTFYSGVSASGFLTPALCMHRFWRVKRQASLSAITALASSSSKIRRFSNGPVSTMPSPSLSGAGHAGEPEDSKWGGGAGGHGGIGASARGWCSDILRSTFLRETASELVRLVVPSYGSDFSKMAPLKKDLAGGNRKTYAQHGWSSKAAGPDMMSREANAKEVASALRDFVRAAPGVRLDCIALGPLFSYDTSSWESSSFYGPAHSSGPRSGGVRSKFGGKREAQRGIQGRWDFPGREVSSFGEYQGLTMVPKGITVMTRIAALMTAYGVTFVEVRGETETRELSKAQGVTTSYCLEPPIHLLVSLADCRTQQSFHFHQQLRRRGSDRGSSIPGGGPAGASSLPGLALGSLLSPAPFQSRDLSYHSSRSSASSGMMFSGLRVPAGEAKQEEGARDNPEVFILSIRHPLAGLSGRVAGLAVEAQRQLGGGNLPVGGGGLLRVEKTDKKGKKTREKDLKKPAVQPDIPFTTSGGALTEAIAVIRQNGWKAFMRFSDPVISRRQRSPSELDCTEKNRGLEICEEVNRCRGKAERTTDEDVLLEDDSCGADGESVGEAGILKKKGAHGAQARGKGRQEQDKVALRFQRVTLDAFLAEQQKVSQALARYGCIIHKLPVKRSAQDADEVRTNGMASGGHSVLAALRQRQQKKDTLAGSAGEKDIREEREDGADKVPVEKADKHGASAADCSSWKGIQRDMVGDKENAVNERDMANQAHCLNPPAKSSTSLMGEAKTTKRALCGGNGVAVVRNLVDMYRACTNGYFKFLEGRCNAVVQPVGDDLF
ncbi:aaa family protein, partial [Cystoisospora suis]